tara:strand:- start:475 stop:909 length:435 start_codon:yes stop_codon:yes gene_type:complete
MMAEVQVSGIIPKPVETVWERIRDFNGLPVWHPAILESRIEEERSSDSVGCVRNFVLEPDTRIRERLLALSDREHYVTYTMIESPVPVEKYVATLRLRPVTIGDQTMGEWIAHFDCAPDQHDHLTGLVRELVFEAGLKALAGAE